MPNWEPGERRAIDPDAITTIRWEFKHWLDASDSLSSHQVIADSGISVLSDGIVTTGVEVRLGNATTVGAVYDVTVRPTTANGEQNDFTISFVCQEQ